MSGMKNKLINLANRLDQHGLEEEADIIDSICEAESNGSYSGNGSYSCPSCSCKLDRKSLRNPSWGGACPQCTTTMVRVQ